MFFLCNPRTWRTWWSARKRPQQQAEQGESSRLLSQQGAELPSLNLPSANLLGSGGSSSSLNLLGGFWAGRGMGSRAASPGVPAVEVAGLGVTYPNGVQAVQALSFQVRAPCAMKAWLFGSPDSVPCCGVWWRPAWTSDHEQADSPSLNTHPKGCSYFLIFP